MKLIKADIFEDPTGIIAHGCNTQGVMGSGIAKIVKDRFPLAYTEYYKLCKSYTDTSLLLGDCQLVVITDDLIIANCFTQQYYGKAGGPYADLSAIKESLTRAAEFNKMVDNEFQLKMPKIGAGLGGLDWNDVAQVVEEVEESVDIEIYVYYID